MKWPLVENNLYAGARSGREDWGGPPEARPEARAPFLGAGRTSSHQAVPAEQPGHPQPRVPPVSPTVPVGRGVPACTTVIQQEGLKRTFGEQKFPYTLTAGLLSKPSFKQSCVYRIPLH